MDGRAARRAAARATREEDNRSEDDHPEQAAEQIWEIIKAEARREPPRAIRV